MKSYVRQKSIIIFYFFIKKSNTVVYEHRTCLYDGCMVPELTIRKCTTSRSPNARRRAITYRSHRLRLSCNLKHESGYGPVRRPVQITLSYYITLHTLSTFNYVVHTYVVFGSCMDLECT